MDCLRPARRKGFTARGLLIAVPLVLLVPMIAWALLPKLGRSSPKSWPLVCVAKRGEFVHEISEQGNAESASNVEVRCEVEARGFWRTTILEIVPEGTYVQPGDFLVTLDSSPLEDLRTRHQILCNEREAVLIKAQAGLEIAKISLREYRDGIFVRDKQKLDGVLDVAKENLRRAERYHDFSTEMYRKGFVTRLTLEADQFAAENAKINRNKVQTKLEVLEKFTREKLLKQLDCAVKVGEANVKWRQHSYRLEMEKLAEIDTQIEECLVTAPSAGQVVYAHSYHTGHSHLIEEGATVRENQVIIRLPNSKEMQIKATISEANVTLVKKGMPVRIWLEALPQLELEGEIKKVSDYPEPNNHWGSNVRRYETIVNIDRASIEASNGQLRPGLSAEIKIQARRLEDQLLLPFQAILKRGEKNYCLTVDHGGWQSHEVKLGPGNGKFVVIRDGIEEGREVVLGAANFRDEVDLPELLPET